MAINELGRTTSCAKVRAGGGEELNCSRSKYPVDTKLSEGRYPNLLPARGCECVVRYKVIMTALQ